MNRKVNSFKQTVFLSEQCAMSKVTSVLRAVFQLWHRLKLFSHSFIALSITRRSKSAQKFAVQCIKSLLLLWQPRSCY